MTIIYHSRDFDGLCSGRILQEKYPEAEMIGYDYGEPIPLFSFKEDLIMADVTFPIEDIVRIGRELKKNGKTLTVIDHHISFYNDVVGWKQEAMQSASPFRFIYDSTISACEAVWEFCFPGEKMPYGVFLLGQYDTWRQKENWNTQVLPFQYGLRAMTNSLENFPGMHVMDRWTWIDPIITQGKAILSYQASQNEKHCTELAFETEFKGLRAICLNSPLANSQAFESVWDESKHDVMICFRYNGKIKQWVYSLYTTKDSVDCSVIAKEMGGGGHKKAAGFQHKDFILN